MKWDIEMIIIHDGDKWKVYNDFLEASGSTLHELDEDLRDKLIKCGKFKRGKKLTVFMGFDNGTLPAWVRQYPYGSHYFNRYVEIEL